MLHLTNIYVLSQQEIALVTTIAVVLHLLPLLPSRMFMAFQKTVIM